MADHRHDDSSLRIQQALDFAANAHAGQFRKGGDGVPYLVHPLRVGELLSKAGCSDELVIAGLLHDVLEDTPVTAEELELAFGTEVLRLVEGASEPDKGASWEERKQRTLDHLQTAPIGACLVTCADKLDNVSSLADDLDWNGEAAWQRFNRGRSEQRWYFQGLTAVLVARGAEDDCLAQLAARLERAVATVFEPA